MNRLLDGYCRLLENIIALFLLVMVVLVFGNVVLRYGFNSGITVSEEVSRWLFVWITFLGAIVALKENAHLGTDMLVAALPAAGKKACLVLSLIAMLYVNWLLFSGSLQQARINADVSAPTTGAPVSIFYASGVVFAVSASVILLYQLWRVVSGQVKDDELVLVKESEEQGELEALQAELAREDAAAAQTAERNHGSRK